MSRCGALPYTGQDPVRFPRGGQQSSRVPPEPRREDASLPVQVRQMASDDVRDAAVLNHRFCQQILTSFDRDEIQALRDWAGEIERREKLARGFAFPSRLLERIGWYTRP